MVRKRPDAHNVVWRPVRMLLFVGSCGGDGVYFSESVVWVGGSSIY